MNKKLLLFEGSKGKGSGETVAGVMDLAQRAYDDFFPVNHRGPNVEKIQKPIFSQKYIRESLGRKETPNILHGMAAL